MEGCALRTGDPLKAEIDKAIKSMKEDGTIQEMYERNFGVPVPEGSATDKDIHRAIRTYKIIH